MRGVDDVGSSKLPMYVASALIGAQGQKCGVPEAAFGGPFDKSDLGDELGSGPNKLTH